MRVITNGNCNRTITVVAMNTIDRIETSMGCTDICTHWHMELLEEEGMSTLTARAVNSSGFAPLPSIELRRKGSLTRELILWVNQAKKHSLLATR